MFKPDTLALTVLLAILSAIGPVSTDIFLPSLPAMQKVFGTDVSSVQLTLSIFMFGFAVGQLVFGPLSDRKGRKPVLIGTLTVYFVGSVACTVAPDIGTMLAGRFFQAIGAAGPIVLTRSVVRDLYEGPKAAIELGRMGLIMGLVPSLAPLVGGFLEALFGWRSGFAVMVLFAVGSLVAVVTRLPETLRTRLAEPFSVGAVIGGFGLHLRNPVYLVAVGLMSLGFGGLFAFISGSSFILQGSYGLGEIAYGIAFGCGALGLMAGNLFGQRMNRRLGPDRLYALGVTMMAIGGIGMLAAVLVVPEVLGRHHVLEVMVPYVCFTFGIGPLFPLTMMRALAPFPTRAGSASSLLGCLQLASGAAVGAIIGKALEVWHSAMPLAIALAILGVSAFVLERVGRRFG